MKKKTIGMKERKRLTNKNSSPH